MAAANNRHLVCPAQPMIGSLAAEDVPKDAAVAMLAPLAHIVETAVDR